MDPTLQTPRPYGVIYKITNLVNGKVYVGKTIQPLHVRWGQHKGKSHRSCESILHYAIRRYGADRFKVEQIDVAFGEEDLNELEVVWIARLDSTNKAVGYNLERGGKGVAKMRAALTGRLQPPDVVARRSERNRLVWKDPARKAKQAEASRKRLLERGVLLGQQQTAESIARASASRKKWYASEEGQAFKKYQSIRSSGRTYKPEVAQKRLATLAASPEKMAQLRRKRSEAAKKRWANPEFRERLGKCISSGMAQSNAWNGYKTKRWGSAVEEVV